MWVLVFKIKCMFLQTRVDKAKLQQDVQRQGRLTLSSWTTIACSRLTTSTSSTNKYLAPPHQPCSKPDTVLVNTLLN